MTIIRLSLTLLSVISLPLISLALFSIVTLTLSAESFGAPRPRPRLFKVALDPGHGGLNLGALDPNHKGKSEKQYTLQLARQIKKYLKAAGVRVWLSREKDRPVSLKNRVSSASAAGVDLFVSIHINDAYVVGPKGHGTFFLGREVFDESRLRLKKFNRLKKGKILKNVVKKIPKDPLAQDIILDLVHQRAQHESVHLAHIVNQSLSEFSPHGTRGVKQADFGVIKGISMPAIVCEVGFINHPVEGPYVTSKKGLTALSKAIALGILRYLTLRLEAKLKIPTHLTAHLKP